MQPEIKAAFEKWLTESDGKEFFDISDLSISDDGDYNNAELMGAFIAFEGCWEARPAIGTWLDVTIGQLDQPNSPHGAPAMSFSTQVYRLPPGHYTIHAVQRMADQSAEDVVKQLSEQTA